MKANLEVKFPCGYEYKVNITAGVMDFADEKELPVCPLHGKKCQSK